METVNSGTSCVLVVSFKNENDIAVIPSSAKYSIQDTRRKTIIKALTELNPTGTSCEINITSAENTTVTGSGSGNEYEGRRIYVEWYYGDKKGTSEYFYQVKNTGATGITA